MEGAPPPPPEDGDVDALVTGLVREFLFRRGLTGVLAAFDEETVRRACLFSAGLAATEIGRGRDNGARAAVLCRRPRGRDHRAGIICAFLSDVI
jgi:hypothetical protein